MAGRPLLFTTPEDLQEKIDTYFSTTPITQQTITGLALALDTSRETLCNYEKKDEYFDAVKKAKDRIEYAYELSLRVRGSAGDIFGLKNFGWRDQQAVDHTTNGKDLPTPILGGMTKNVPTDDGNEEVS